MTIYYCMFALFIFLYMLFGALEKDALIAAKKLSWSLFALVFFVVALRHPSMGVDLGYGRDYGYLASFHRLSEYSINEVIQLESYLNYEKGFVLLNKVIGLLSKNYQVFLAICAFLSIFPIAYAIAARKNNDVLLSWLIYLALPCFLMTYSGLRQAIAIGLVFYSLIYIEKKRFVWFVVCILLASSMHSTAIVCLAIYPAYHIKIGKSERILTIAIFPITYIFRRQIFLVLSRFVREGVVIDDNGSSALLILFIFLYIVCTVLWTDDNRYNGYMNIFACACFCQCLASVYTTATRVGYYFTMVLPLLLPVVSLNFSNRKSIYIFKMGVGVCFIIFSLYNIVTSSWAQANPYSFFWQS